MNEAEIARIIGGRSNWEKLKAAVNKWSLNPAEARSITPDQQAQIRSLVKTVGDKLRAKQSILVEANRRLAESDDPMEHRSIIADVDKRMSGIDQGGSQAETRIVNGTTYEKGADGLWHKK